MIDRIAVWLRDPAQWSGASGIPVRTAEHLLYSVEALALAALIALPLGLWIGHTGRGRGLVVGLVGAFRAIPTLGLLYLGWMTLSPHLRGEAAFTWPSLLVLSVLAVPPILSGAYAGVAGVDPAARDAARGLGLTGWQRLWQVEVPNAMPLIFSGLRSAMLQIIATATIAAVVSLGGLGRYLIDGQAQNDYAQMAGGALLVAALALLVDLVFAGLQRLAVPRGLQTEEI